MAWRSESSMAPSLISPPAIWAIGSHGAGCGAGQHLEPVAEDDGEAGLDAVEDSGRSGHAFGHGFHPLARCDGVGVHGERKRLEAVGANFVDGMSEPF